MIDQRINDLESSVDLGAHSELVPVHIRPDEVMYFNILQGGQSVDDETGLREYTKLGLVLQEPKMRSLFINMAELLRSRDEIPEDIAAIINTPVEQEREGFEAIESDTNPEVQAMAATGDGEDKVLVMMPQHVVDLFDEVQGGERTDSELGLQEFFLGDFFDGIGNIGKSVVRTVATVGGGIGGFMLGGPAGAAAGAGLGNMLGRNLTGQKFGKDMLVAGAQNALIGYGAGSLGAGGYLGSTVKGLAPVAAGTGATAAGLGAQGAGLGSTAAGAGGGAAAAGAGAGQVGNAAATTAGMNVAPAALAPVAPAASAAASPGMFSGLSDYAVPAALFGGAMLMGKKGEKKRQEIDDRHYEEDRARTDELNKRAMGKYNSPYMVENTESDFDPARYQRKRKRQRREEELVPRKLKTGGKVIGVEIKGRGTGQSDHIPRTVPENSWVWDATTVAHAGDGTTNAGQRAIEKFEKSIRSSKLPHVKNEIDISIKKAPLRKVPCALSNGERVTPPHLVAAAGDGCFDRGASVLRKMTKELRRHKASKGLDLPPAAHDLTVYYKKALRGE